MRLAPSLGVEACRRAIVRPRASTTSREARRLSSKNTQFALQLANRVIRTYLYVIFHVLLLLVDFVNVFLRNFQFALSLAL